MKCPRCKQSDFVEHIGYYSMLIAIDDAIDISQYWCGRCNYEWEN